MRNNIFVLIRVILGAIFIVSGFEKAVSPAENFLYIIQGYQLLPDAAARLAAVIFPWVELFVGAYVLVGLWLEVSLKVSALISLSFIGMVGQAIVRHLPLDNCGCFGSLVHLPLKGVIVLDVVMLTGALGCLRNIARTRRWSMDGLYEKVKGEK